MSVTRDEMDQEAQKARPVQDRIVEFLRANSSRGYTAHEIAVHLFGDAALFSGLFIGPRSPRWQYTAAAVPGALRELVAAGKVQSQKVNFIEHFAVAK